MNRLLAVAAPLLIFLSTTAAVAQEKRQETPLETFLMLPEPRALRTDLSTVPKGATQTVLTPAREITAIPGLSTYSKEEFRRVGFSLEKFQEHARKAADKLLPTLKPELVRDDSGRILCAVYTSERPIIACLLLAPSLPALYADTFGPEVWAAVPDRNTLVIFPAKPEALRDFTAGLTARFRESTYAASPELFLLKPNQLPEAVASFDE